MKKFASVLLAVLVAFSMFSFVVSAADASLTVTADKTNVKVGDTVTVTVKLGANSGLSVLTLKAKYDATALKATDMKAGDLGPTVNVATGIATMATATTFEAAGTVCTMTFKALKAGEATVTFDVNEAYDDALNEVKMTVGTAKVTVADAPAEEPTTEKPSEAPSEKPSEEPSTEAPSTEDPSECKHETMSNWAQTKAPTCQEAGVETRNCTVCGYAETRAVDKVACSYKWEVTKKATATENGEKVLKCVWCGDIKDRQILAVVTDGEGAGTIQKPVIPGTDAIA